MKSPLWITVVRNTLLSALFLVSLSACVSNNSHIERQPLKQKVMITVEAAKLPVTAQSPLSWAGDVVRLSNDQAMPAQDAELYGWMKTEIQSQIEGRGFQFAEQDASTRYQLTTFVGVGDGEQLKQAQALLSLYPSLAGESQKHPKGTLLMGILDVETQQVVWRGALEVFVDPTSTVEEDKLRVSGLLQGLLRRLTPGRELES